MRLLQQADHPYLADLASLIPSYITVILHTLISVLNFLHLNLQLPEVAKLLREEFVLILI